MGQVCGTPARTIETDDQSVLRSDQGAVLVWIGGYGALEDGEGAEAVDPYVRGDGRASHEGNSHTCVRDRGRR